MWASDPGDRQTTSHSSRFLDACRAFNRGELAEDRLVATTARFGFNNVIDAFHVVGAGLVPVRFFMGPWQSVGGRGWSAAPPADR
jgi:hypothetical protein